MLPICTGLHERMMLCRCTTVEPSLRLSNTQLWVNVYQFYIHCLISVTTNIILKWYMGYIYQKVGRNFSPFLLIDSHFFVNSQAKNNYGHLLLKDPLCWHLVTKMITDYDMTGMVPVLLAVLVVFKPIFWKLIVDREFMVPWHVRCSHIHVGRRDTLVRLLWNARGMKLNLFELWCIVSAFILSGIYLLLP